MYQIKEDQTKNDFDRAEDTFFEAVPDEAIERTAQVWGTGAFTLGNCTGLGSCPA